MGDDYNESGGGDDDDYNNAGETDVQTDDDGQSTGIGTRGAVINADREARMLTNDMIKRLSNRSAEWRQRFKVRMENNTGTSTFSLACALVYEYYLSRTGSGRMIGTYLYVGLMYLALATITLSAIVTFAVSTDAVQDALQQHKDDQSPEMRKIAEALTHRGLVKKAFYITVCVFFGLSAMFMLFRFQSFASPQYVLMQHENRFLFWIGLLTLMLAAFMGATIATDHQLRDDLLRSDAAKQKDA
jgi:hypothetical protein